MKNGMLSTAFGLAVLLGGVMMTGCGGGNAGPAPTRAVAAAPSPEPEATPAPAPDVTADEKDDDAKTDADQSVLVPAIEAGESDAAGASRSKTDTFFTKLHWPYSSSVKPGATVTADGELWAYTKPHAPVKNATLIFTSWVNGVRQRDTTAKTNSFGAYVFTLRVPGKSKDQWKFQITFQGTSSLNPANTSYHTYTVK